MLLPAQAPLIQSTEEVKGHLRRCTPHEASLIATDWTCASTAHPHGLALRIAPVSPELQQVGTWLDTV